MPEIGTPAPVGCPQEGPPATGGPALHGDPTFCMLSAPQHEGWPGLYRAPKHRASAPDATQQGSTRLKETPRPSLQGPEVLEAPRLCLSPEHPMSSVRVTCCFCAAKTASCIVLLQPLWGIPLLGGLLPAKFTVPRKPLSAGACPTG